MRTAHLPHPLGLQPPGVAAASPSATNWPGVWRGDAWLAPAYPALASGHPVLDRALPGGGWPQGQLTELLHPAGQHAEWRLLLPALTQAARSGPVLLVGPPHSPNLHALAAQGLPSERLWRVDADTPAHRLWATEQALRCPDLAAAVVWLPLAQPEPLRRLHTLAQSSVHAGTGLSAPLLFAWRPLAARSTASPAALRLQVESLGLQGLRVDVFKRRGPPLERPLTLAAPLPLHQLVNPLGQPATWAELPANRHVVDRPGRLAA